ncbi:MAG TPA: FAD-binding oxidoreductase [Gemmatimonadales bacterium]|nr:FAD-binding oxidoreductase [Gemmatimonadales bacterium]
MFVTDPRIRAAYAEGAGMYRIVPDAVAIPRDTAEVVALVKQAAASHTALIPRGAGSGMPGGNIGRGAIVDMSNGFSAVTVDAQRRTARAGASVTWAEVNEAAKPYGLRLPPDPSSGLFATSGGMVATNAAGPRTVRYGSVRGWVEGVEIVEADGNVRTVTREAGNGQRFHLTPDTRDLIASRFPKTRKNSSGYALDAFAKTGCELDLLIGSEGTLAIVTEVEWRLDPIPPAIAGATFGFADLEAMAEAVPYLLSLKPSALELLDETLLRFIPDRPNVACLLIVEFERESAAAARGVVGDAVRGLKNSIALVETAVDRAGLDKLWQVRRLASPALARLPVSQRSLQVIEDGCVPVERLGEYITGLRDAASRHGIPVAIFGHAGDGHVHVNALPDITRSGWRDALRLLFDDVTELLIRLGGVPSGEHGVGRLRAGVLERFYGREVMDVFRSVKRAYDPLPIFNPGVIIPATDWSPLGALKVGDGAAAIPDDIATRLREVERNAAWGTPKAELTRSTPGT